MNGLMLHCGASAVARHEIGNVELPPATKSYQPLAHDHFLDIVEDQMRDVGFGFGDQGHGLTKDGKRYFGLVELLSGPIRRKSETESLLDGPVKSANITGGRPIEEKQPHVLIMGIRNSLDKAFAASVSFGARVFVCDNLSFTGEQVIGRKHTVNILRDLPGLVTACVSQTKAMEHVQNQRFERYQECKLSDTQADRLIIEMLRRDAVNTSRIGSVVQEWYEPTATNADGELIDHGPKRVWRLFNAVTESLKGAPLHDMPRRTIELQAICDRAAKFQPEFKMAA